MLILDFLQHDTIPVHVFDEVVNEFIKDICKHSERVFNELRSNLRILRTLKICPSTCTILLFPQDSRFLLVYKIKDHATKYVKRYVEAACCSSKPATLSRTSNMNAIRHLMNGHRSRLMRQPLQYAIRH